MTALDRCRFAPSTTGPAHLGTALAGLLAWLDARSRNAHLLLRLEDIDPDRCRPEFRHRLETDLDWLGLRFDAVEQQHAHAAEHERALDVLAAGGLLYPCSCSRAVVRAHGRPAADGGFVYPGTCRSRPLPAGEWRDCDEPLRFKLPAGVIAVEDEGGLDLTQDALAVMGDPVVRRRDGAIAYVLAAVVDDAGAGITRVVRGRDIGPSTATQVALQRALGFCTPAYRHHLLLLEPRGNKLAKLHGSVGLDVLRAKHSAPELVGFMAFAAGLLSEPSPCTPAALLAGFDWRRVANDDGVVAWDGHRLALRRP